MMPSGHQTGTNCKGAFQKYGSLQVITFISPLLVGQNRKPGAKTSKIPLSHRKQQRKVLLNRIPAVPAHHHKVLAAPENLQMMRSQPRTVSCQT
jgi:hypothetical protein